MARRVLYLVIALSIVAGTSLAGDKQKTGEIVDNVFTDNLYGFTFKGFENWKFNKPKDENPKKPRLERFNLVQKNYQIPAERRANQEDYTPPVLGVWVDTCSMSVKAFADEIADRKSKLKARKELSEAFTLLQRGSMQESAHIQIDGVDGVVQQYRYDYEAQVYSRATDSYSLIEDFLLGDIFIVKRGDHVFAVFFRAERLNYRTVREEVRQMILTMDFDPEPEPEDTEAESEG